MEIGCSASMRFYSDRGVCTRDMSDFEREGCYPEEKVYWIVMKVGWLNRGWKIDFGD